MSEPRRRRTGQDRASENAERSAGSGDRAGHSGDALADGEGEAAFPRGTFISPNKKIWWADEVVTWQREVDGRRRGRRQHPTRSKSTTT